MRLFAGRAGQRDERDVPARQIAVVAGLAAVTTLSVGVAAAGGLVVIERTIPSVSGRAPMGPLAQLPPLVLPEPTVAAPEANSPEKQPRPDAESHKDKPQRPELTRAREKDKDDEDDDDDLEPSKRHWWLEDGEIRHPDWDDDDREECGGSDEDWPELEESILDGLGVRPLK